MATRPSRSSGLGYIGRHRYLLMLDTADQAPHFRDAGTVRRTRTLVREAASHTAFVLCAYCFMPTRLCLLVEGESDTADLRRFVVLSKQRTAHRQRRLHAGKLWHAGYAVRRLDPLESVRQAAGELLRRPWQDGLVGDPREYPFLGSDRWSVEELLDGHGSALSTRSV